MYQLGDRVVYGIHGICCVAAQEDKVVDRKRLTYLVLEPEGQPGDRYYVPAQNAAALSKLRPLMDRQGLESLVHSAAVRENAWNPDENRRKQRYRELINGSDPAQLLQMVYTLYRHREAQSAAGRKVHQCDENFLRDAEKLISGEISAILGLSQEEARGYLRSQLTDI